MSSENNDVGIEAEAQLESHQDADQKDIHEEPEHNDEAKDTQEGEGENVHIEDAENEKEELADEEIEVEGETQLQQVSAPLQYKSPASPKFAKDAHTQQPSASPQTKPNASSPPRTKSDETQRKQPTLGFEASRPAAIPLQKKPDMAKRLEAQRAAIEAEKSRVAAEQQAIEKATLHRSEAATRIVAESAHRSAQQQSQSAAPRHIQSVPVHLRKQQELLSSQRPSQPHSKAAPTFAAQSQVASQQQVDRANTTSRTVAATNVGRATSEEEIQSAFEWCTSEKGNQVAVKSLGYLRDIIYNVVLTKGNSSSTLATHYGLRCVEGEAESKLYNKSDTEPIQEFVVDGFVDINASRKGSKTLQKSGYYELKVHIDSSYSDLSRMFAEQTEFLSNTVKLISKSNKAEPRPSIYREGSSVYFMLRIFEGGERPCAIEGFVCRPGSSEVESHSLSVRSEEYLSYTGKVRLVARMSVLTDNGAYHKMVSASNKLILNMNGAKSTIGFKEVKNKSESANRLHDIEEKFSAAEREEYNQMCIQIAELMHRGISTSSISKHLSLMVGTYKDVHVSSLDPQTIHTENYSDMTREDDEQLMNRRSAKAEIPYADNPYLVNNNISPTDSEEDEDNLTDSRAFPAMTNRDNAQTQQVNKSQSSRPQESKSQVSKGRRTEQQYEFMSVSSSIPAPKPHYSRA